MGRMTVMSRLLSDQQAARAATFGLNADKVEVLLRRAGEEVAAGLLPAAQLAIARQGEVVLPGDWLSKTIFAGHSKGSCAVLSCACN